VNINSNLSICCEDAEKKITLKTKAIIPVHMDGLAADMNGVLQLAEKNNLIVIEDVAQAIGGSYKNKKLGSLGLFGCYSLNENKNISCGEGGALTTNDLQKYETAFRLHDTPVQFSPSRKDTFKNVNPEIGYSMRASEIQGTIMRVQLSRLEGIIDELKKRKTIFKNRLGQLSHTSMVPGHCEDGDCGSAFHLRFEDIEKGHFLGQKLRNQGLAFFPVTSRPAHAAWNWIHLLPQPHQRGQFIESIEILSRTYKINLSLDWPLAKTQEAAEIAEKILKEER
jgi:dTDP-4-amino-4,6-dideoxygalactose transaminase